VKNEINQLKVFGDCYHTLPISTITLRNFYFISVDLRSLNGKYVHVLMLN